MSFGNFTGLVLYKNQPGEIVLSHNHSPNSVSICEKFHATANRSNTGIQFYVQGKSATYELDNENTWKESPLTFEDFLSKISNPSTSPYLGIWFDESSHSLYISREAFGRIPAYYLHVPNEFLIISTNLSEITLNPLAQDYLSYNPIVIYNYLTRRDLGLQYSGETFFSRIHTTLTGHLTKFTSTAVDSSYCLSFSPSKWSHLKTIDDFGNEFKRLFSNSITKSIALRRKISAHLSGGLDSSSIVCMIRHLKPNDPINCFYLDDDLDKNEAMSDDRKYCHDVITNTQATLFELKTSSHQFLESSVEYIKILRQPPVMVLPANNFAILEKMKEQNSAVLLTGFGGDYIVGYGKNHLNELWNSKNWQHLKEAFDKLEMLSHSKQSIQPSNLINTNIKLSFIQRKLIDNLKALNVKEFIKNTISANRHFDIAFLKLLKLVLKPLSYYIKQRLNTNKESPLKAIVTSQKKQKHSNKYIKPSPVPEYAKICDNQLIKVVEEFFHLSNHFNCYIDHPFLDLSLYELCVAVPSKLKFSNGIGRGQQREGLRGILTEAVRNRYTKTTPNLEQARSWVLALLDESADLVSQHNSVWEYVNRAAFFHNVSLLQTNQLDKINGFKVVFQISRTISLAIWLNQMQIDHLSKKDAL